MWPMLFLASSILKGFSQYQQGQYQAGQYKAKQRLTEYNARITEADAAAAQRKTDFEQTRAAMEAEQIMGSMRVAQGASGARTDVGTPILVRAQQWAELELENFLIGLEGRTQVSKYRSEAAIQRVQASVYGQAAKNAKTAGKLGMATTILGGFAQAGAMGMFDSGSSYTPNYSTTYSNAGVAPVISGNRWSP